MFNDPVCKAVLHKKQVKTTYYNDKINKTHYFCSDECRDRFMLDPEKYTGKGWFQRALVQLAETNAREFAKERLSKIKLRKTK